MNIAILKDYIEKYKNDFPLISNKEIYKWKAIKQFQDNFDLEASDFHGILDVSLRKTGNLLDSQNYFPRGMLLENAEKSPEEVRALFRELYTEEEDISTRILNFQTQFKSLSYNNFGKKNDYQDHRSINVYLTLKYPERYYFYKYNVFKDFSTLVEYPVILKKGIVDNVTSFIQLCNIVNIEIEKDKKLLELSTSRLKQDCYNDLSHNVLTQDFIYSVARYFNNSTEKGTTTSPLLKSMVELVKASELKTYIPESAFIGRITHEYQNELERKALGTLGEKWVFNYEREFLRGKGLIKLAMKVTHSAEKEDGLGYDVLSYDESGKEKYIEVKTTRLDKTTKFYLTRNELARSKIEKDNYYLYRVYDFDQQLKPPSLLIIQGDLSNLCEVPVSFEVKLMEV